MDAIDREELQKRIEEEYCKGCKRIKENGTVICRACWVDDAKGEIDDASSLPKMRSNNMCDYCRMSESCDWGHNCGGVGFVGITVCEVSNG